MRADHFLLDRMQQSVRLAQVFDGQQVAAIQRRHELNAGIYGTIKQLAVLKRSKCHGAGAAISFGATFLGTRPFAMLAQIFHNGHCRCNIVQLDNFSAKNELYGIATGHLRVLDRRS